MAGPINLETILSFAEFLEKLYGLHDIEQAPQDPRSKAIAELTLDIELIVDAGVSAILFFGAGGASAGAERAR